MKSWMMRFWITAVVLMICAGGMANALAADFEGPTDVDSLNLEAYLLGEDAIGRTVHVVRSSYVRSEPDLSSEILTDVIPDDRCAILDICMASTNPLKMWLKIDFFGMEGWVHAGCGKIVAGPADSYTPGNNPELEANRSRYIGQTMRVNVDSGNARAGAGLEYPVIEYVRSPELYRILDCDLDSEGKLWLMIKVDSNDCWIRSSLVDYIGD